MRLLTGCCCVLLILFSASALMAQESEPEARVVPEIRATRVNPHAPTIDGNLNDEIWNGAKLDFARNFRQRDPDEGQAATESTLVAIVYDDDALYVAFWCYDSEPELIQRQLVRRDRGAQSDRVAFRVDPFHDHQSGFNFEISAAGVLSDDRIYNDNNTDDSWDAVWDGAVKMQPWGWSAEMRIPFHCLRFAENDTHVWGVDFARVINRKDEGVRWAFTPQSEGGFTSNFGHLTGIEGIAPAKHLEMLPYVVSSAETSPKTAGNPDGRDYMGNAGFDIKYALSSDLILDATINPDFGQVELDAPVLNLSTYETFFPERRPFFVEGADLFHSEFTMFYSRRIGRSPDADVDDDEADFYTDYPKNTTILGAAKLTGKLAARTSIALLTAVTQEESADYGALTNLVADSTMIGDSLAIDTVSIDTVYRTGVVEPKANYTIIRLKQELFRNSFVGTMLTLASREGRNPAVTGGLDWRLYTNDGKWYARGQAVFSRIDPEEMGYGFDLTLGKDAGEHVRGCFGFTLKNRDLNINHLGYNSRNDSRSAYGWLQYRTNDDWWIVRNSWNDLNLWSDWNYDGVNYSLGGSFNTYIDFTNFWSLGGGFNVQGEKYSDLETRGNGLWIWPECPTFSWWANLATDGRKKVSLVLNPGSGSDRGGSWWAHYTGLEYRPRSNMEFELGVNYKRFFKGTRWVENYDSDTVLVGADSIEVNSSSLFADLDRDHVTVDASASIVIDRNLSIQLSAEGLISGLNYSNHRHYQGENSYVYPVSSRDSYDYNYSSLNSTLLIRWEYDPGSTLYLVWTRSRPEFDDSVGDLDLSRDFDRLFSGGGYNTFLIKTSYWLNL